MRWRQSSSNWCWELDTEYSSIVHTLNYDSVSVQIRFSIWARNFVLIANIATDRQAGDHITRLGSPLTPHTALNVQLVSPSPSEVWVMTDHSTLSEFSLSRTNEPALKTDWFPTHWQSRGVSSCKLCRFLNLYEPAWKLQELSACGASIREMEMNEFLMIYNFNFT